MTDINYFTLGELICHLDAAIFLINVERLEKDKHQIAYNPDLTSEGRDSLLKSFELQLKSLEYKYDNLE